MRNFLPFGRSAKLVIPPNSLTNEFGRPRRISTRISDLGTGGYIRAHLQDVMILAGHGGVGTEFQVPIQMRMGIYGKSYMTEDLYDYKVYEDGVLPTHPVWNWGKPYRLHPGEYLRVRMGPTGPEGLGAGPLHEEWWPMGGVLFNGVKTENGEPFLLYDLQELARVELGELATAFSPIELGDVQLDCPRDSPIDLYSVTLNMMELDSADALEPRLVYIRDHNDRAFWMRQAPRGWIQLTSTPILLGEEWTLEPDETITFEFQPYAQGASGNTYPLEIEVLLRGTMEVEDGR